MSGIIGLYVMCPQCGHRLYVSFREHSDNENVLHNGKQYFGQCGNCNKKVLVEIRIQATVA